MQPNTQIPKIIYVWKILKASTKSMGKRGEFLFSKFFKEIIWLETRATNVCLTDNWVMYVQNYELNILMTMK